MELRRITARPSARSILPPVLDPKSARIEFGRRLWAVGLGREADGIVANGLDGVRLVGVAARAAAEPPRSWLGGAPDLPDDLEWPTHDGVPLAFLAQIDLAEVHAVLPLAPLPPNGALAFFYAWRERPRLASCEAGGAARLVHIAVGTPIRRRRIPAGVGSSGRFRQLAVEVVPEVSFPLWIAEAVEDAADELHRFDTVDGGELDELLRFADAMANAPGEEPLHRLLGHPTPIQHDVTGEGSTLLLQLDSDAATGMRWGDSGMTYWTFRDDDLAARRWDQCQVATQSC